MTTRAQLATSVDAWLARDDVAVTGPDFIQILLIAESQISVGYRFSVQEQSIDLVFTGRSVDLPANFLEVRNPFIDDTIRKINFKTPKAIRESTEWTNGRVAAAYTIEGGGGTEPDDRMQVTIAGPASVASPLTMTVNYYKRFAALTAGVDTNWLLINHFEVYLYETLRAAGEYIQEAEIEASYTTKAATLRELFSKHENRKRFGAMPKQGYASPRTIV